MKSFLTLFLGLSILSSCSRPAKELGSVKIGMTKTEVSAVIGEPKKKNVINETEIWDYPDSSRTVVFRMDTVYSIMTSARARLDSVNTWLDSTNQKVKKQFGKAGDKLEDAAEKIQRGVSKDSIN